MRILDIDFSTATFDPETGFLTFSTDIGYEISAKLSPHVKIQDQMSGTEPILTTQINTTELSLIGKKNAIKTQEQLNEYLKKTSIVPKSFLYEDILIGFIYSNQEDPTNHQWMLQIRNEQGQFIEIIPIANKIDISVPTSTYSWFEGQNWHGRMKVIKSDIEEIKQLGPDHIEVIGKKCGGHPKGDLSLIPEETQKLVISYNIFTNKWYVHCMKENKELKEIKCDNIITDCKTKGFVNRSFLKPKVTQEIDIKDISSIQFLSNTVIIYGI